MPKIKRPLSFKLWQFVAENPDFETDGQSLFCKLCNKHVSFDKLFSAKQHMQGTKHMELKAQSGLRDNKLFLPEYPTSSGQSEFAKDLCQTFMSAGIPLSNLRNPKFKRFLEKYTNYDVPSETNLHDVHIKTMYDITMKAILAAVTNRYTWISIDGTTDASERYIASVVIGILDADMETTKKKYLLNAAALDEVNDKTIARLFNDSLILLGSSFNRDSVLLLLTDAASYMSKAAQAIQIFYPKITHVTCTARALHRVCEKICSCFSEVERLIDTVTEIFERAPARISLFRTMTPEVAIPPQPDDKKYGTWIEAVNYYTKHFEAIVRVINALDPDEAAAIEKAKRILTNEKIYKDLIYITTYFGLLPNLIYRLELADLSLYEQMCLLSNIKDRLATATGRSFDEEIRGKFKKLIEDNAGISILEEIVSFLSENAENKITKYTMEEMAAFKYAPTTAIDVEKNFPMFKQLVDSEEDNEPLKNLAELLVVYCNHNLNLNTSNNAESISTAIRFKDDC